MAILNVDDDVLETSLEYEADPGTVLTAEQKLQGKRTEDKNG